MKCAALVAAGTVLLFSGAASPFQPLITDDTGTQGTGGNQVEVAYNRTVEKDAGARSVGHEVPIVYTRGITDALDLYIGVARLKLEPPDPGPAERGWGNIALGAKWRFYENEATGLSLGLKPEVRLPVSESREARGLGTARTSYAVGLLATQELPFGAIHANLAAQKVDYSDPAFDAAERRTRYRASIAPVWDVTEHWKLALDVGWVTNPDPAARRYLAYGEIGAIYAPMKDLEIALGVIRNFRDGAVSTTQATLGVTWRFR